MIRKLEILIALETILWGIWVGNPWWAVFPTSTAFSWMAELMPEWLWGLSVGILGCIQLISGLWNHSVMLSATVALMSLAAWMLVWLSFVLGNWRSTAVPIYAFFIVLQIVIYIDGLTVWTRRRNGTSSVQ